MMIEEEYFPKYIEANYFPVPNMLVEKMADISPAEIKVILYIIRHTWGWINNRGGFCLLSMEELINGRKIEDGRCDKGVGMSRPTVLDAIRKAISKNLIICITNDSDKARIKKWFRLRHKEDDIGELKYSENPRAFLYIKGELNKSRPKEILALSKEFLAHINTKDNNNKYIISSKEDINGSTEPFSSSRISSIKAQEAKPPTYSQTVHNIFEYYISKDIISHKKGTSTYYNTLTEIKNKLRTHSEEDIRKVIDSYSMCLRDPNLQNKINKGNKLSLAQLLNNKFGKFEWFNYFLSKSYDDIKEERLNRKGRPIRDSHSELTKEIANTYAYEVMGYDEGYPDLGKDLATYEKFKVAGDKLKEYLNKNNRFNGNKMIGILIRAVKRECDEYNFQMAPGRLCSNHCWKVVIPQYIKDQFLS